MNTMQKTSSPLAFRFGFVVTGIVCLGSWFLVSSSFMLDQAVIVPGVKVGEINVGRLKLAEAHTKLEQELPPVEHFDLVLLNQDQQWATPSSSLNWHRDLDRALTEAQLIGRQGGWAQRLVQQLRLYWQPITIEVPYRLEEDLVSQWVASVSAEIDQPGNPPQIVLQPNGYEIDRGQLGQVVDQAEIVSKIMHHPSQAKFELTWEETNHPLTDSQLASSEARLTKLWGKQLKINVSELEPQLTLTAKDFFPWLQLPDGLEREAVITQLQAWNEAYKRPPQNARLEIGSDQTVSAFEPHRLGRALDEGATQAAMVEALEFLEQHPLENEVQLSLAFQTVEPEITLDKTNDLGINELIGLGTSTYFGSIPNRVYNVNLTSERLHATVVPPGEEFSFNRSVGEVSSRTGYRSAYVIRNGRTELGDGGGVCQVSTTTFRAALNAGLPITAWKAHSYRVSYYEQGSQPGFDATVYAPSTDFRFLNDTGHHLLVGSYADTDNRFLRVEIWGTADGRESEIKNYSLENHRPAPAPLYQEDPSLPPGTRKQIDWAAAGATASFEYEVKTASGEPHFSKTFRSVYRPWQAVYLVGPTQ